MPLLRLILAFFLAAPVWAEGAPTPPAAVSLGAVHKDVRAILDDAETEAAERFLGDEAAQTALRQQDPGRFELAFRRANELVDLKQVLTDFSDVAGLRVGLMARSNYEFLGTGQRFFDWAKKQAPGIDLEVLKETMYDWSKLTAGQKRFLTETQKMSEEVWLAQPYASRVYVLSDFAKAEADRLVQENPKTGGELAALQTRIAELWPMLSNDERQRVGRRIEQFEEVVAGFKRAEEAVAAAGKPELKTALAAAQKAGTVDQALNLLSKVFDGLGQRRESVEKLRPSRPEESLSANDNAMLGVLLKGQYESELSGSEVGEQMRAFYKGRKWKFEVADIGEGALLHYDPSGRVIRLNQRFVEEYLRSSGRTVKQLLTDDAALRPLVLSTLPGFVHETVHAQQHVWSDERKVPLIYGQEAEVEAMGLQALFVLQKGRNDKKPYMNFLTEEDEKGNVFARSSLQLARMLKDDPAGFPSHIRRDYYPENSSFRGSLIEFFEEGYSGPMLDHVKGEIKRRAGLKPAERRAINDGGFEFKDQITREQWLAGYAKLPDAALETFRANLQNLSEYRKTGREDAIRISSEYRKRDEATLETFRTGVVKAAGSNSAARDPLGMIRVPSPARNSAWRPRGGYEHSHDGASHSHGTSGINIPHVHEGVQ